MLPLVLVLMNASGTYDEHILYLQQARELWSALTPHERSRSIERHVRAAASGERTHTARLVMLALRRDELLDQLRSVRDSCASWQISEAELVQTLLALQPRRLAGMGEAELLNALVELLPPDQAAPRPNAHPSPNPTPNPNPNPNRNLNPNPNPPTPTPTPQPPNP